MTNDKCQMTKQCPNFEAHLDMGGWVSFGHGALDIGNFSV